MTDKDKLDYLGYIKGFIDEATAAFLRGDDDTYFEALDSVDALLMCLLHDDDEEDDEDEEGYDEDDEDEGEVLE